MKTFLALALVLIGSAALCAAQSGGASGSAGASGSSTSSSTSYSTSTTGCSSITTCTTSSHNYNAWSQNISFDSNGRTNVSFTTNTCPSGANSYKYSGASVSGLSATASCTKLTLPAAAYVSTSALASPIRNAVGFTLRGANIYGPMDAGFTLGQVCTNGLGTCSAGTDLSVCSAILEKQCGTSALKTQMFLDDCGGHANPYHFHSDLKCEYNYNSSAGGHSPLIGIMLDGRGLYGQWEDSSNTLPTLDACGGHTGPTPASFFLDSNGKNVSIAAQTSAYHYHIVAGGPNTISCYGPVASVTAAKNLYPSYCNTAGTAYCTSKGNITYNLDCPIFNQQGAGGVTLQLNFTSTEACPACTGNCVLATSAPTRAPTAAPTAAPSAAVTLAPFVVTLGLGVFALATLF